MQRSRDSAPAMRAMLVVGIVLTAVMGVAVVLTWPPGPGALGIFGGLLVVWISVDRLRALRASGADGTD